MARRLALAAIVLALATPASARSHPHHRHTRHSPLEGRTTALDSAPLPTYLPHPSGCPARQFCACGAAVEIFGSAVKSLWAAASWFKFPRSAPAPGMVAVRAHHVFVLRQQISGPNFLVADYNSGAHLSRLHVRSIAGFTIVNPHGARYASR